MSEEKITISVTDIMKMAAEVGAKTAIDKLNQEKKERLKSRFDRRLRNTEILLRNYRNLVVHKNDSIYSSSEAIEILDEMDSYEFEDEMYVESIKKSKDRTAIIIAHVNKMLEVFRYVAEKNPRPEEQRKFKVLYGLYIDDEKQSAEQICDIMKISQPTFYRDKKAAIQFLSTLLFGVDSLKVK